MARGAREELDDYGGSDAGPSLGRDSYAGWDAGSSTSRNGSYRSTNRSQKVLAQAVAPMAQLTFPVVTE